MNRDRESRSNAEDEKEGGVESETKREKGGKVIGSSSDFAGEPQNSEVKTVEETSL